MSVQVDSLNRVTCGLPPARTFRRLAETDGVIETMAEGHEAEQLTNI